MNLLKIIAVATILAASSAYAEEEPTDPKAIAREELMKIVGKNTGVLGDMAGGKSAFDAAAAGAAKTALVEASAKIAETFKEPGAADPASSAKPEIWTNWEEFLKKADALNAAATAMDLASAETIGAGMGGLGGACKDCHTTFRVMKQ